MSFWSKPMYLYVKIYFISLILFKDNLALNNRDIVIDSGFLAAPPSTIGLQFYVDVKNLSDDELVLEVIPDQCCLSLDRREDCDSVNVVGECWDTVEKGASQRFKLIAPILDWRNRNGYCRVHVDSRPVDRKRGVMRDPVKIDFDTTVKDVKRSSEAVKCDSIDEDPLDECKPVNCVIYYNGRKPYYDEKKKRCTAPPECFDSNEISNRLYDPNTNECVNGNYITESDIDNVKTVGNRHKKDIIIIKKMNPSKVNKSNSFILKNVSAKADSHDAIEINRTPVLLSKDDGKFSIKQTFCNLSAKFTNIMQKKCTAFIVIAAILIQCCIIIGLVVYFAKKCTCGIKKKPVTTEIYNYRQDISVTTPLIPTSNIDTETTEPYMSESSNIDKKIKCYKACHREKHNAISMSDDILSKCLTRRDWGRNLKSEIIPEVRDYEINVYKSEQRPEHTVVYKSDYIKEDKKNEAINYENEKQKCEKPKQTKADSNHNKADREIKEPVNSTDLRNDSSETEIRCHTYSSTGTGFKANDSKNVATIMVEREMKSLSTEKAAQIAFSNDSIEDFLSERGMIFCAGESISKYSFSSASGKKPSSISSDLSNKTSKNIVKNMLTLFQRKLRHGPKSEPGNKKPDDVQLLHMSEASLYSSSNNDNECMNFKKLKESRSSL